MRFFSKLKRAFLAYGESGSRVMPRDLSDNFGVASAAGVPVSPQRALGLPAVLCAVSTVSEVVGMLPLLVYKREGDSKRRAREHPLYRILRRQPNRFQTAMKFKSALQAQALLFGNGYAEILRTRSGNVAELLPLWPPSITIEERAGALIYIEHGSRGNRELRAEQVFHLPGFSMTGLVGLMPTATARDSLGLALALTTYASKFFENGAWLGGVFSTPYDSKISVEQFNANGKIIDELYVGVKNAYKPKLLQGVTWTPTAADPEKAQSLESRAFSVQDVARLFRVLPHILMDLSNSIKSNITEQGLQFKGALLPWGERWAQRVGMSLLDQSEQEQFFAGWIWDGLVQSDLKTRSEAYMTAIQGGWMSRDEVRARENLDPLPNGAGKVFLQPLNMAAVGGNPVPAGEKKMDSVA